MIPGRTIASSTHGTPEWRLRRLKSCLEKLDKKLRQAFPGRDLEALQYIFDERHRAKKRIERVDLEVQKQKPYNAMQDFQAEFKAHHAEFLREMREDQQ